MSDSKVVHMQTAAIQNASNVSPVSTVAPAKLSQERAIKVYQAINNIQAELSQTGISKNNHNKQQGFKFRGIDDVYNAVAPLLARHRLVIMPNVLERQVVEKSTRNGGTLSYITLKVQYDFISTEDGSSHSVVVFGEAMDSGDKGTGKALSAAYKYAAFQVFCIPTEGDNDADSTTHYVDRSNQRPAQNNYQQQPAQNQQYQPPAQNNYQQSRDFQQQPPPQQQQPTRAHSDIPPQGHPSEAQQFTPLPVILPWQYKEIRKRMDLQEMTEEKFCQSTTVQSIGELAEKDYARVVQWLDRRLDRYNQKLLQGQ